MGESHEVYDIANHVLVGLYDVWAMEEKSKAKELGMYSMVRLFMCTLHASGCTCILYEAY